MQFTYYTDKTVPQCMAALNERMQAKETSSRPAMDGWVEKNGRFCIGMSSPVVGNLSRKTYLTGKIERENSYTVVRGSVSNGVSRSGQLFVFGALGLVALALFLTGNAVLALLVVPLGAVLYIPMKGDHTNSSALVGELQRTLKARTTPPKKPATAAKKVTPVAASAKPAVKAAAKTTTARTAAKPAAAKSSAAKPAAAKPAAKPATQKPPFALPGERP